MYKQVLVIREDLKMSSGKIAAQCAHASINAWRKSGKIERNLWRVEGEKKVVLKAKDEKHLIELKNLADKSRLPAVLIKDAGRTEIPRGTITCLGIGPSKEKDIDKITSSLPLLK